MVTKIINLKSFREETSKYLPQIEKGISFIVFRRSKPLFTVSLVSGGNEWKTLTDFTKIKKDDISAKELLQQLSPKTYHHEYDWGKVEGREVW